MEAQQKYDDSVNMDDSEQLLDNSDVERWSSRASKQSKRKTCISTLREYWWIIATVLMIVIIGLQLMLWRELRTQSLADSCTCTQIGGDYLNKGPIFTTDVVKWQADPEFVPLNVTQFLDPKVLAKWETIYPTGAAFLPGGKEEAYNSTSVTYQLHCVFFMAKAFSAVLTDRSKIPEPDDYERHFLHCADYMRQAAMCTGDVTIEPRGENGKPGSVNLDNAFNGLHVCKDYSEVKNYLQRRATKHITLG